MSYFLQFVLLRASVNFLLSNSNEFPKFQYSLKIVQKLISPVKMTKKKFVFSNNLQKETIILAVIKILVGATFLGLLIYHIYKYTRIVPIEILETRGQEDKTFIQRHWKDQNSIARFLMWGRDRRLLMMIIPYLDCVALTGVILLIGAIRRTSGLLQLWIIISIMFCMLDMILLIPAATYADDKAFLFFAYIHSYMQKIYGFWICKSLLLQIAAEDDSDEPDPDFSAPQLSPKKY